MCERIYICVRLAVYPLLHKISRTPGFHPCPVFVIRSDNLNGRLWYKNITDARNLTEFLRNYRIFALCDIRISQEPLEREVWKRAKSLWLHMFLWEEIAQKVKLIVKKRWCSLLCSVFKCFQVIFSVCDFWLWNCKIWANLSDISTQRLKGERSTIIHGWCALGWSSVFVSLKKCTTE